MKKVLGLLLLGLIVFAAMKLRAEKEAWKGLSEAQARARLEERLPSAMPPEKVGEVTEKVISKMRERGYLADEPVAVGNGG